MQRYEKPVKNNRKSPELFLLEVREKKIPEENGLASK